MPPSASAFSALLAVLLALPLPSAALNNGLALTPPCGLNSYMAGKSGAAFLRSIADFFASTGMQKSCFTFVNTDEGWELPTRDPATQRLQWDPAQYPMGIPNFTATLAAQGIKFGLYGAASGVTCGGISGQLGYEDLDVETFLQWGVGYLKSDNCASYAMDSSVRFAATRDALLRAKAGIVFSIEPFSISPDLRQSSRVANLWRIGKDISGSYVDVLDRASISDKWAPVAGPGGWNDPDMINVGTHLSDAENRVYFGLWAILKAPLLLSADLPNLPASIQQTITNPEVAALNQDALGVQARKILLAGNQPVPFLVGFERCDAGAGGGVAGLLPRSFPGATPVTDTRVWTAQAHATVANATVLVNAATNRCLSAGAAAGLTDIAVLLPCNASDPLQAWTYSPNAHTVAILTNAGTGLALAASNATLFSAQHGDDPFPSPDASYGAGAAVLLPPSPTQPCTSRDCQGYEPSQLFYGPDLQDGFIAQSTFTSSINHCFDGSCYELTHKQPTFAHHCLAHVLSVRNGGTDAGETEVWAGPLSGGAWVLGLLNAGGSGNVTITAPFSAFEMPGIGPSTAFCVRDVWARANLGVFTGSFSASVGEHDLGLYRLTPGTAC